MEPEARVLAEEAGDIRTADDKTEANNGASAETAVEDIGVVEALVCGTNDDPRRGGCTGSPVEPFVLDEALGQDSKQEGGSLSVNSLMEFVRNPCTAREAKQGCGCASNGSMGP